MDRGIDADVGEGVSGDWIKVRNDLSEDPAVIAMAAALKIDEYGVVGRLHALWAWADRNTSDGFMPGIGAAWINRKVHTKGFAEAMVRAGWLTVDANGVTFPHFERHNGKPAKARAIATVRQQTSRNAKSVTESVTDDDKTSRRQRDKSVTREEKRRDTTSKATSKTKPARGAPPALALPDWLPAESWERWRKHRGRKLSPEAAVLQLRKLESLRSVGHEPGPMIDLAIESGWATFWPPKAQAPPNGNNSPTLAQRRTSTIDKITGKQPHERDITTTSSRVDCETVHPTAVDLRESGRDNVGSGGPE